MFSCENRIHGQPNGKKKEYTLNTCWRDGPALLPMSSPADQAIVEPTSPGEQIELGTVPELVLALDRVPA